MPKFKMLFKFIKCFLFHPASIVQREFYVDDFELNKANYRGCEKCELWWEIKRPISEE